jgi:predicted DsbA family dithiol-disulfide isomerase
VRLETLADQEDGIRLRWRSFFLRPFPEQRSIEDFRSYTARWGRPAALEPGAEFRAWATDAEPPSHSVPPAVAGKVAWSFGEPAFLRYHRALLHAYFAENRTISDRAVLVAVAGETGLEVDLFSERLDSGYGALEQEVAQEHNRAIQSGITAVPSVVVGGRYLVTGAVDVEQYRRVIFKARDEGSTDAHPQ